MKLNFFFKKKNIQLNKLFSKKKIKKNFLIKDIKPLLVAGENDLSFFDSIKYKEDLLKSKAGACLTTKKFEKIIPQRIEKIIVDNVLFELAKALKKIYPFADIDLPDLSLKKPNKKDYKSLKFGNNVLIGDNVKIGKNSIIGSNSIIEKNVSLGQECVTGSNIVIKYSMIGNCSE